MPTVGLPISPAHTPTHALPAASRRRAKYRVTMPQLHSRHDAIHLVEESLPPAGGLVILIKRELAATVCLCGVRLLISAAPPLSTSRQRINQIPPRS
ncbi:hypothetical protein COMA2_160004 [Candidatus Nitrospira nitrificans]|uniref:Uncharacterized protein n=1 Tax=Candidatus Nitrospira nitrificans TaxID=1742973 RepID=A0A0S4LBP7_9BACT|nr:hypothetical protein COMA2_160004 [Candidatus Nitrospira nitrificans]